MRYRSKAGTWAGPSGSATRCGGRKPWPAWVHAEDTLDQVAGFFDWDFAGPVRPEWDLAFAAFSWVYLHHRRQVAAEGFTVFGALLDRGVAGGLDQAVAELARFPR